MPNLAACPNTIDNVREPMDAFMPGPATIRLARPASLYAGQNPPDKPTLANLITRPRRARSGSAAGTARSGWRLSQGSLGVGPPVGLGGEQVDDQREARVVVSAYLVEECLVCGDDDVEALHGVGDDRARV